MILYEFRETEEKITEDPGEDFRKAWAIYPRKVARGAAEEKWCKKIKKYPNLLMLITNALKWQIHSKDWKNKIIPNFSTYLHQERFRDDPQKIVKQQTMTEMMSGRMPDDWDRRYQEKYEKN